jgi:hypothetical protein
LGIPYGIVRNTLLLSVLCFVANPRNMARFAAIEAHVHALPKLWIARFIFTQHQYHVACVFALWLLSLHFGISCIEHAKTYSIINSLMGIVCKMVIKNSYDAGKVASKVVTISSSHTCTSKHVG